MEDIFAGIMVADALQRQNTESALNDMKRKGLERDLDNLKRDNQEKEAARRVSDSFSELEKQRARDYLQAIKDSKDKLIKDNIRLQKALTQGPNQVSDLNEAFKNIHMNKLDILAEWMASQKGYKDIANKFGKELGLNEVEISKLATNSGIEIFEQEALDNSKIPEAFTNSDYSVYNPERVERVKSALSDRYLK